MPDHDDKQLPALVTDAKAPMPFALAILFDDRLFERVNAIADKMAKAQGMTPQHLLGKADACFAVVERAVTWRLSPWAVASATYMTPAGRVGFEGKLIQAVLENSGAIEGHVRYEHYGDWSQVQGKFEIVDSKKDNEKKFASRKWGRADTHGLGVTVRMKVRGEDKEREWSFDLVQAFPLNSTLWATDPKTQICYAAVRRFANLAAPGLLMGLPFEDDEIEPAAPIDITPPRSLEPKVPRERKQLAEPRPGKTPPPAAATADSPGHATMPQGESANATTPTPPLKQRSPTLEDEAARFGDTPEPKREALFNE